MSNLVGKSINTNLYIISDNPEETNSDYIASIAAVNIVNNKKINLIGSRGKLAGNETATQLTGSQTINIDSPDTIIMNTSGSITLAFTPGVNEQSAVKLISLKATRTTTITISGAVWANAEDTPMWGSVGKNLVLVANFIHGRVILNVFDNDEV